MTQGTFEKVGQKRPRMAEKSKGARRASPDSLPAETWRGEVQGASGGDAEDGGPRAPGAEKALVETAGLAEKQ